ncbi:MAG: helix-turn-helix domain-containing protein [Candidatus Hydrogenedentes bacterium]|nr:helix-turn-helix domain-containing protein [Candidatus Hydrogenedentota bacterium]
MTPSPSPSLLTLPEAAAYLGRGGKRPSTVTVWRWCRKGCRGVSLKYLRMGREIRVTEDALRDFGQRLAQADRPLTASAAPTPAQTERTRTDAERDKAVAEARENLRRRGCLK